MNQIICKLEEYTNFKIKFTIPFPVERSCTWKEFYIGETKRNLEVRWNEHCL